MSVAVAVGFSVFAFIVGTAFGCLLTLIFVPAMDDEKQSRAVAEEHKFWHHPRERDDP